MIPDTYLLVLAVWKVWAVIKYYGLLLVDIMTECTSQLKGLGGL